MTASSADRTTAGRRLASTAETAESSNARSATAAATTASTGSDADNRWGVGESCNRAVNTWVVASNPNAVTPPDTTCSTRAVAVSARDERQASAPTVAPTDGTARTERHSPAAATSALAFAHPGTASRSTGTNRT